MKEELHNLKLGNSNALKFNLNLLVWNIKLRQKVSFFVFNN